MDKSMEFCEGTLSKQNKKKEPYRKKKNLVYAGKIMQFNYFARTEIRQIPTMQQFLSAILFFFSFRS